MKSLLLILFCIGWLGCAGTNTAATAMQDAEMITVEGQASVRGNTPFTAVLLETSQRNLYVLVLDDAERQALEADLPTRLRVTGMLSIDTWNGIRYAHLKPTAMDRL